MNRQEKGITLIALVITIVVLVILVGVSVSAAINTGLIQNSKNATANYSEEQKQEEEYLDNVAGIIDQYTEGTLANLATKGELNVGDYIQYSYNAGEYIAKSNKTGSANDQTFNSSSSGNVQITNWRVLSTNDGIIKLIGVLPEETQGLGNTAFPEISATKKLTLDGADGFINAPEILNGICETLYSGNFGTARSINVDDILELTGYEKTRYYWNNKNLQTAATDEQKTLGDLEADTTLNLELNENVKVPTGLQRDNLEVNYRAFNNLWTAINLKESTDSNKQMIYELLFKYANNSTTSNNGASYWLASTCNQINFSNSTIKYRVYISQAWGLGATWTYHSDGIARSEDPDEIVEPFCVRPIVTLKSGLTIDSSVEGKDGKTPATAWIIK